MDSEHVIIRGATGVDLALPIAGPGSRTYAFLIDWHIRVLVALAWLAAAMLALNGALTLRGASGKTTAAFVFLALLPPLAIYFLYHPVIELLMRGQTPGKRLAGVRIVDRDGGIPGVGAILIRNIFRLVDSLPAFYVVGLSTTFVSAQRVRIGDLAAGTLLVLDEHSTPSVFPGASGGRGDADVHIADLAAQILERWPALAVDRRAALARALLARAAGAAGAADAGRFAALGDAELRSALAALAPGAGP
jgi:uncharacterized RDD family membrane protein YckC